MRIRKNKFNKEHVVIVFVINLIIASLFFVSNSKINFNELSSDLANIIPICKKIDNPSLYRDDLYLNDINNVRYYTPFFIETLRFISNFTQKDYFLALNILSFVVHVCYGVIWFLLFYSLKREFWLALLFSIFIRGVIWPPGMELLGISDLWTIMPRTVYLAFLPIPFLIYQNISFGKWNLMLAAFLTGLIFNFHPISGVGGVIIYFTIYLFYNLYDQDLKIKMIFKKLILAFLFCFFGMLPYLITYFLNINNENLFNEEEFHLAFLKRIPHYFTSPVEFLKNWNRPVLYILVLFFCFFYFYDSSKKKIEFKLIFISILMLFLTANGSVYIEEFINYVLNKNLRMSFQLIRFQKYIITLLQVALYLFVVQLFYKFNFTQRLKKLSFFVFIFFILLSKHSFFEKVPVIGEDMVRMILPSNLNSSNQDYNKFVKYIKANTHQEDVFYGKGAFFIRGSAERSVVLDGKGAGMLIEGNPKDFILWYKESELFKSYNIENKIKFLRKKGVNYVVSVEEIKELNLEIQIGKYHLYKI